MTVKCNLLHLLGTDRPHHRPNNEGYANHTRILFISTLASILGTRKNRSS